MIVQVTKLDGSDRWLSTGVERIEENDDLEIVFITDHSEPEAIDIHTHRIDVLGVG